MIPAPMGPWALSTAAHRQSNLGLRQTEIDAYIRRIQGWGGHRSYLITVTQDRSLHTRSDQVFQDQVEQLKDKILRELLKYPNSYRHLHPHVIGFFENADPTVHFRHIHSIWTFPGKLAGDADRLLVRSNNPSDWWKAIHPRGTIDIRPLDTLEDVQQALNYSTKKWERCSIEDVNKGSTPSYFHWDSPYDPAKAKRRAPQASAITRPTSLVRSIRKHTGGFIELHIPSHLVRRIQSLLSTSLH